jgi:hypothetical protein
MSPIKQWGPATWTMFHVLVENIKEEHFSEMMPNIFLWIKIICTYLPCPDCALHAKTFLNKVPIKHISTKHDFTCMLFAFHNMVNMRKRKLNFKFKDMDKYKGSNIIICVNEFLKSYNTNGNMNQIAETQQRVIIIADFVKFIRFNRSKWN